MTQDPIVILSYARTPMGSFQGCFSPLSASELGAEAVRAAVKRAGVDSMDISEAIIGNVLSAGQGQAPARQAVLGAGLPKSINCTTINKMCGSGMKATMLAHDLIRAGSAKIVVAGGMESMSNTPYLAPGARSGLRMGHGNFVDHMFLDGLEDAYDKGTLMGRFAENCAEKYQFSRQQQDEFAIVSHRRAQDAQTSGKFISEITPVTVNTRKSKIIVEVDEPPFRADIDKIPKLRPAFKEGGTITAANSSSISDGAAALILTKKSDAERRGLKASVRIMGHSTHAQEPSWFTTAPIAAISTLLENLDWTVADVDLFEINEAFAVVTMAAMHDLNIPHEKINVHGGACALGHPIGASGTRIIVTLIAALQCMKLKRGVAALCIGGGEATAVAIEID